MVGEYLQPPPCSSPEYLVGPFSFVARWTAAGAFGFFGLTVYLEGIPITSPQRTLKGGGQTDGGEGWLPPSARGTPLPPAAGTFVDILNFISSFSQK